MREITVNFLLTDEQEPRLKKITEGYKRRYYEELEEE